MKSEEPVWEPKPILSEVLKMRKYENRVVIGLSPEPYDEKTVRKDPTTRGYVKSPVNKTLEQLI